MATYAYQQNYYAAAEGYVKYNVSPDLGTPVAPGEKVTFSGVFKSRDFAIVQMEITLRLTDGTYVYAAKQAVSAKKNVETAFTFVLVVPEPQNSSFPASGRTVPLNVIFSLDHTTTSGDVLVPATTQQLTWLRYRINPEIKLANFYRYGIDETSGLYERKNDGIYCMCAGFQIALASGRTAADITVARITTSVQRGVVNLSSSVLTSALSAAGYVEQLGPSIFKGMSFTVDATHILTIEIGDAYDVAVGTVFLPRSFANMCLCNYITGGVCFGGFPKSTLYNPLFENYYPMKQYAGANFYNGIGNVQAGTIETLGNTSSGSYKDGSVTFPTPFAAGTVPIVVITFRSSSTAGTFGRCCVSVLSADNTGFSFRFFNGDSSNRSPDYNYIAYGVPA